MNNRITFLSQTYLNMVSGYGAIALAVIVNIMLVPLILSNLGKELYGLWFLIFNVIGYFYLADFGVTNAITRLHSKYKVIGGDNPNQLLATAYLLILAIDLIVVAMALIFQENIIGYLEIEDRNKEVFGVLFLIAVFELGAQFILRVNLGVIRGEHQYNIAYNLESLASFLRITSLFVLIYFEKFTVINFAICYSVSKVFSDALSFYFLRKIFMGLNLKPDVRIFKELIDNSGSTLLTSISATIYNSLPLLLFGKIFGIDKVFLYSIPFAVMIMLSRLINILYAGFTPRAAELKAMRDEIEINRISNYAVKVSMVIGSLSLIFFIIFGYDIFEIWLGNEVLSNLDLQIIYNIFMLLMTYLAIANLQNANIVIYQAAGLHWYVSRETVISALLLMCLSFLFLDSLEVYSFAIAMIFVGIFKYLYYKYIGASKFQTYSISPCALIILVSYVGLIFGVNLFLSSMLIKLVLFVTSSLLLFTYVYKILCSDFERNEILGQLKKINFKFGLPR